LKPKKIIFRNGCKNIWPFAGANAFVTLLYVKMDVCGGGGERQVRGGGGGDRKGEERGRRKYITEHMFSATSTTGKTLICTGY
jgi:hypothetical protein